jgi:tRNA methyl transferase.
VENSLNIPAGASVAVALSGGIDSLMAANELVKRGYGVFGLHARL